MQVELSISERNFLQQKKGLGLEMLVTIEQPIERTL
jgi:hypothetical protein